MKSSSFSAWRRASRSSWMACQSSFSPLPFWLNRGAAVVSAKTRHSATRTIRFIVVRSSQFFFYGLVRVQLVEFFLGFRCSVGPAGDGIGEHFAQFILLCLGCGQSAGHFSLQIVHDEL